MTTPTTLEERFDEKFPHGLYGAEWYADGSFKVCWGETPTIKDFIQSEILLDRATREGSILGLLKIAICPDTSCDQNGTCVDGNGEPFQCQWCDERRMALLEDSK